MLLFVGLEKYLLRYFVRFPRVAVRRTDDRSAAVSAVNGLIIGITDFDFIFSKSCYICEPISRHLAAETVAYYYYDYSSSLK
jgi:hypothetical protein